MITFPVRLEALAKYLKQVAIALTQFQTALGAEKLKPKATSEGRKNLHLLYLLNDILHHLKYHGDFGSILVPFAAGLENVVELVTVAICRAETSTTAILHKQTERLLAVWGDEEYFTSNAVARFRSALRGANAADRQQGVTDANGHKRFDANNDQLAVEKGAPFIMPALHGDPSVSYYDLPAATMLPHITPNSTTPINPKLIKPLQFVPGPASERLANAVRDFLLDAEEIYRPTITSDDGYAPDIDDLGQPIIRDRDSGAISGDSYYGWSRAFCEQMRKLRSCDTRTARGRSPSRSRSTDKYQGRKRRPSTRSRSGSFSSCSSRSGRKLKRSKHRSHSHRSSSSTAPGRLTSRQRSRSPASNHQRNYGRGKSRSVSRDMSYSPELRPTEAPIIAPQQLQSAPAYPVAGPVDPRTGFPLLVPPFAPFNNFNGLLIGVGGFHVPARPPGHQGGWPPPPPPPQQLPSNMTFNMHPGTQPSIHSIAGLPPLPVAADPARLLAQLASQIPHQLPIPEQSQYRNYSR